MTRAVDGIVFDKDGTLFDFARTWETWAQAILVRLASDPDMVPLMGAAIGFNTDAGRFARDSVALAGTPLEIAEALDAVIPDMSLPDIIQILDREAARAPQYEATPLVPLFEKLRSEGYKLGVATNDAEMPALAHLDSVNATPYLDFVAGYDSGFGGKPEPGQLIAFCQKFGLDPERCVMVGDSLHDLRAGRAAQFMTVGVLTGYAQHAELAEFASVVLPDIGHLPDWLNTL